MRPQSTTVVETGSTSTPPPTCAPLSLAAAKDADGVLRLKPQNLLTNLPLAGRT